MSSSSVHHRHRISKYFPQNPNTTLTSSLYLRSRSQDPAVSNDFKNLHLCFRGEAEESIMQNTSLLCLLPSERHSFTFKQDTNNNLEWHDLERKFSRKKIKPIINGKQDPRTLKTKGAKYSGVHKITIFSFHKKKTKKKETSLSFFWTACTCTWESNSSHKPFTRMVKCISSQSISCNSCEERDLTPEFESLF